MRKLGKQGWPEGGPGRKVEKGEVRVPDRNLQLIQVSNMLLLFVMEDVQI